MDGTDGRGGSVNLAEASARLGVSTSALRKRILRNSIPEAYKVEVQGVSQWYIPVDALDRLAAPRTGTTTDARADGRSGQPVIAKLDDMAERMTAQEAEMRRLHERVAEMQADLARLIEMVATPRPVADLPAASQPADAPRPNGQPAGQPASRPSYPWWHWRRWVLV